MGTIECSPTILSEHLFEPNELPRDEILDILNVFSAIYYADITTKRNVGKTIINVDVPVGSEKVFELGIDITHVVNFMAANEKELWKVNLSLDDSLYSRLCSHNPIKRQCTITDLSSFDHISTLSGGLDSYLGASLDFKLNRQPFFITFKSNTNEYGSSSKLFDFIEKQFKKKNLKTNRRTFNGNLTRFLNGHSLSCYLSGETGFLNIHKCPFYYLIKSGYYQKGCQVPV